MSVSPCVPSLRPFYKDRGSPATHAPLRGRQAFGRVPAPAPFRGRRCPACGFRLRPCLEPSLNRPGAFRFPGSALRGGMRGRFPLPHPGAGGTVPAGPRLDALRAVPLSGYPARNAPVPLRSGRQSPGSRTASLHFNLAHSDSLALLAVRQDAPVGVDVEPVRPLPEAMLIACRWFSAPEIRWIAASDDRDRAFLRCWVCREAFLKATVRRPWAASGQLRAPPMRRYAPSGRGGPRGIALPLQATSPPWPAKPFFLHADTRRFHAVHVFTEIRHCPRRPARRPAHSPRLGLGAHRQGCGAQGGSGRH